MIRHLYPSLGELEVALRWALRFPASAAPRRFRDAFAALASATTANAPERRDKDALSKLDETELARRIAYWETFLASLSVEDHGEARSQVEATLVRLRRDIRPVAEESGGTAEGTAPAHRQLLAELVHDLPPCVVWRELSGDAALGGIEEGMNEAERTSLDIDIAAGDIDSVRVFNGRAQFLRRQVFWAFLAAANNKSLCAPRLLLREGEHEPLDLLGDVDVVYGTGLVEDLVITTETAPAYLSMALDLVLKGQVRCPATSWPVRPVPPEISEPAGGTILLTCRLINGAFAARATFAIDRASGHITFESIASAEETA